MVQSYLNYKYSVVYINVYLYAGGTRKNQTVLQIFVMPSSAIAMNIWVTHHALSSPLLLTDVISHLHRSEVQHCIAFHIVVLTFHWHIEEKIISVNKSRKFRSGLKHMLVLNWMLILCCCSTVFFLYYLLCLIISAKTNSPGTFRKFKLTMCGFLAVEIINHHGIM